jgi:L-2-hydroxycarboxylate dehydrogenase (NAD+)
MANTSTVTAAKLTDFVVRAFLKVGVPEEDARIAAGMLVGTDLRGIDSHGVARLFHYIRGLKEGRINPKPETRVISQAPATAILDGDHGLGFVVGYRAMTEALCRADFAGAGFVSVRNSTHFGAGSNYSRMALPRNMIGISMTAGAKGMVAPGSLGPGAGINVLSIAAPSGKEAPFVLDMATTVVAAGKVEIAHREGKTLPEGWAVDRQGGPITDPGKFRPEGSLLPLGINPITGAWKGFGLTVAVDILCSVLSGSEANTNTMSNHFFGALRIESFIPIEDFKKAMEQMYLSYRSLPKMAGVESITLAGEPEQEIEKRRRSEGIPLNEAVIASLQKLAGELNIEYGL